MKTITCQSCGKKIELTSLFRSQCRLSKEVRCPRCNAKKSIKKRWWRDEYYIDQSSFAFPDDWLYYIMMSDDTFFLDQSVNSFETPTSSVETPAYIREGGVFSNQRDEDYTPRHETYTPSHREDYTPSEPTPTRSYTPSYERSEDTSSHTSSSDYSSDYSSSDCSSSSSSDSSD